MRSLTTHGAERPCGVRTTLLLVVSTLALLGVARGSLAQALDDRIEDLVETERLEAMTIDVAAVDVATGERLCSYRHEVSGSEGAGLCLPASNMKLLTSGAALLVLGADYEFTTNFTLADGRLVITGAGDPALADPDLLDEMGMDVKGFVSWIADAIEKARPDPIREVVADDRVFDREYVHPDWESRHLHRGYGAEVSGLNFHRNVLRIFADRGRTPSELPTLRSLPGASWIELVNHARTGARGSVPTVWAAREDNEPLRYAVRGIVTGPQSIEVASHESSLILAHLLADELASRKLTTPNVVARLAGANEALGADAIEPLAVVRTPLSVVLERCNKESENLYAESLIKLIGHQVTQQPGSWSNGAAVVRIHVRDRLGPQMVPSVLVRDGSGLSRSNRVSAELLATWLASLASDPKTHDAFIASMPEPGEGTLKQRFQRHAPSRQVRAKSGYINNVRTLSGYLIDEDSGRTVAFSVLVNDIPDSVSGQKVKNFHERVVDLIDQDAFPLSVEAQVEQKTGR